MKKFLSLLLCSCLVLGMMPVLAEDAAQTAAPQIGDTVYGFEAVDQRDFPQLGAVITHFVHARTGAELLYVANDDTNREFELNFKTDAIDNTGLPHVFEHATLDGSEKYPSKALFFNLLYRTYNTYMNAYTEQRYTSYQMASLSEKQLLAYADYYTDSCLHPMLLQDESIYREEAWRYRLAGADAPLTIEGTVYSEMLGHYTVERVASLAFLRAAFPGSTIGNDEGGDPDDIPSMTLDALRSFHDLYYHPSNCVAILYGDFEDYTAFLKLLDESFEPYEKREFVHEDPLYTAITEPVVTSVAYPVEAGSSTDNTSTVYYGYVVHGADAQQLLVLNTLTDLFASSASPLQQRLKEALPTGSFYSYIATTGPDPAIVFIATNVPEDAAATFQTIVDEAVADVAENGFDAELVDSVMANLAMGTLLSRENADVAVNVMPNLINSYITDGNPWSYPEYVEALSQMDAWNAEGRYADVAAAFLKDSHTTALVTAYPVAGLKEEKDAELAARLAEIKAGMSEEEIAAIVTASNAIEDAEDTSDLIAQLQAVTVSSLPEEIKQYDISDATEDGVRYMDVTAAVDGVGQANIFLNADFIAQDDIHWFKLYTQLLGELDTLQHSKAEIATLSSRYLYNKNIRLSVLREGDGYHPFFRLTWVAMDDDLATGYDLMHEIAFESRLDNAEQVLAGVQNVKQSLKSSITSAPYSTTLYRALGRTNALDNYYIYANGTDYYAFLEAVEAALAEDPAAVTEKLAAVQQQLKNRSGAVMVYAGSEESIALNRPLEEAFLSKLDSTETNPAVYDLPIAAASEALVINANVQYNTVVADYATLGLDGYDASLDAITSLVLDTYLYPLLRDQYGAYSVFHAAMEDEGVYIISYRDPNVVETFEVYQQLPALIEALEVDQETLDGYILSSYATYAKPSGELTGAMNAAIAALGGKPQDLKLTYMRQLKAVTPEKVKDAVWLYTSLINQGTRSTAGGASIIAQYSDLYDSVLNPFGTVDTANAELTDVTEGEGAYEAIRFVLENGLMAPAEADRFGTDVPALNRDLVAAIYVAIGGSLDADEAAMVLPQYGLLPADVDLDAELTDTTTMDLLGTLFAAVGAPFEAPETSDAVLTRGELAVLLQVYLEEEE